jgi:hypothetical protein
MQVYVGDGLKFESKTYYPVQPPKLQADPIEKLTYAEVSKHINVDKFSLTQLKQHSKD